MLFGLNFINNKFGIIVTLMAITSPQIQNTLIMYEMAIHIRPS